MVASTDFLPFAIGGSANVESQASWSGDAVVTNGFSAGLAQSSQINKAHRQASFIAAGLANFVANQLGIHVADDGNMSNFIENLTSALAASGIPGEVKLFNGASAPAGWAICDGGTYPKSDGTGNVTVPDLRGKTTIGVSSSYALGVSYGALTASGTTGAAGAHTPSGIGPAHTHSVGGSTGSTVTGVTLTYSVNTETAGGGSGDTINNPITVNDGGHTHALPASTGSAGTGALTMAAVPDHTHSTSTSTLQPSLALNYIIKL